MELRGDGVTLHAHVDGPEDGPLVVFLHGVSASADTYGFLPQPVTAGRRIVRLDLRGHGASERAPGTYTVERHAADVVAVLEALGAGARPAALVGHSLGGVVAWTVAQRRPDLVAGAFLEDPPLYLGEPAEHERNGAVPIFQAMLERAARWHEQGLSPEAAAEEIAAPPLGPTLAPDAPLARARALLSMDPGVLEGAIDGSTLAGTDTTGPVTVPVMLLAADDAHGAAFAARHEARLRASHPDVEIVRVADVGHGIHDDAVARARWVQELTRFLERVA
ncbi:MAG: alpha/beta fold hydrolase [Solirubrobacteraceae bacterium]|nr:alpha/beta fold hydrolase [Solirubrobacteraceae bacterium]